MKTDNLKKGKTRNTRSIALVISLILVLLLILPEGLTSTGVIQQQNATLTKQVKMDFFNNGRRISNMPVDIYKVEKGFAHYLGRYITKSDGWLNLKLPRGTYILQPYKQGSDGYHGYKKITIDDVTTKNPKVVHIEVYPNYDNAHYVNLNPSPEDVNPTNLGQIRISTISSITNSESLPIYVNKTELQNLIARGKPVSWDTIDPNVREILKKQIKNVKDNENNIKDNLGNTSMLDDKMVWITSDIYAIVESESVYTKEDRDMVIDSEQGLTHTLDLTVYNNKDMTLYSSIAYSGISASGTMSKGIKYKTNIKITVSDGQEYTIRQRFNHTLQHGKLYSVNPYLPFPIYLGEFDREYISGVWTGDCIKESGEYLPEVRNKNIAKWGPSQYGPYYGSFEISDEDRYTGSIGISVARKDLFGESTKLTFKLNYEVRKTHTFHWDLKASDYYLEFYTGRIFDINTLMYYTGSGGGCPFISAQVHGTYVIDNNLLPQSEMYGGNRDWIDYYSLEVQPTIVKQKVRLALSEFEQEHSYIDNIKLLAVIHMPKDKVAVDMNGNIFTFSNPESPISAVDENGTNRLPLISKVDDGLFFDGQAGNRIYLSFNIGSYHKQAILVLRTDVIVKESIFVDVFTQSGWVEAGFVEPRVNWAYQVVNLTDFVIGSSSSRLQVRLRWTGAHKLDFVGIYTRLPKPILIRELQLIGAIHSKQGNVLSLLARSDNEYVELLPGEKIYLTFNTPLLCKAWVSYVVIIEGHYYTITS